MIPTNDAEANNMTFVVQDLQSLRAISCRESRDNVDLSEGTHVTISDNYVTTLHEVLVSLRVIESSNYGPHNGDRGSDLLYLEGAALVRTYNMVMIACDSFWDQGGTR